MSEDKAITPHRVFKEDHSVRAFSMRASNGKGFRISGGANQGRHGNTTGPSYIHVGYYGEPLEIPATKKDVQALKKLLDEALAWIEAEEETMTDE